MNKEEFDTKRKELGWSKRELANRLGITERTIHGYMAGNKIPQTVEYLFNMLYLKHGGQ
ncbi:MAG: helix-turn-helix transcriptional regulator [Melioribacteraceae bacterium]